MQEHGMGMRMAVDGRRDRGEEARAVMRKGR